MIGQKGKFWPASRRATWRTPGYVLWTSRSQLLGWRTPGFDWYHVHALVSNATDIHFPASRASSFFNSANPPFNEVIQPQTLSSRLSIFLFLPLPSRPFLYSFFFFSWAPTSQTTQHEMAQRTSLLRFFCSLLLLATFGNALKFELEARKAGDVRERCVRNFVGRDTLIVVTAIVSGNKGDGQQVNIQVRFAPKLAREPASCLSIFLSFLLQNPVFFVKARRASWMGNTRNANFSLSN